MITSTRFPVSLSVACAVLASIVSVAGCAQAGRPAVAEPVATAPTRAPGQGGQVPLASALPPKYLGVKDFKLCLALEPVGSYTAWCLPVARAERCPQLSWDQLNALAGIDKLPACQQASPATPASGAGAR